MQRLAPPSTFGAELGATLRLAAPLAVANLLQMAVYAVDVIFVARLGQEALAAASLSTSLFGLLVWSFSGLTGAVAPLVAAELGRRRHAVREVRRSMRMALWLTVMLGAGGMLVCSFGKPILLLAGQEPSVASLSGRFLDVLKWALVPMVACNVLRIFVAALDRAVYATVITGLAIVVNAFGNYAFVFGHFGAPALGLQGSAISSIITSVAMLLAYAAVIRADRRLRVYRIFGRWWHGEWERLREIVRIGTPIAIIVLAEGGLFGAAAFLMGLVGEAELAGHTITLQVAAFAFQVPFGVGQAATIRVGYRYGTGDSDAVGRAGWAAIVIGMAFASVSATAMLLFPSLILSAYVDVSAPANAPMVRFAMQYLFVAAVFQLSDGLQAVAAGALRGIQDTRVPMIIALFGYWGAGFCTAIVLGFLTPMDGVGIWVGLAVGLTVAALLLVLRWYWRERFRLMPRSVSSRT